ncbi:MAG: hypothetical protein ACFFBP_03310 [Promethearchaeota archaeon]
MKNLLVSNTQADYFLYNVEKRLSSHFHAGVICDKDGFIISARIPRKNQHLLNANTIALSAIANKKKKVKNSEYIQVIRDLDDSKNILLIVLLRRDSFEKILTHFRELNKILSVQEIF